MRRVLIFGAPGVGKGTQGGRLAAAIGVPAISTGDLFRAHVKNETELGVQLQHIIGSGDFVPDSITNAMVAERLADADCADGFLLDGYPRTADQVAELDRMLADAGTALDCVAVLEAPDDVLELRLLARAEEQGRTDDTIEVIRHRLELYHGETQPLVTLYETRGLAQRVNGVGTLDAVHDRLRAALGLGSPATAA